MKLLAYACSVLALASCATRASDVTDGLRTVHFENSDLVRQTVEMKNGKRHGELREYYRNGKLKCLQHYVDDKLNDSSLFYYESGQVAERQYFKDTYREGKWTKYNEKGILIAEHNFSRGLHDGSVRKFTVRTGRLLENLNYNGNRLHGKQEYYHNNGQLRAVAFYSYGAPKTGLEEFRDNGEKIDNSTRVSVTEKNTVLLDGKLLYYIQPEPSGENVEAFLLINEDKDDEVTKVQKLKEQDGKFILSYQIPPGGHVLEKARIGIFRKTSYGNTAITTHTIHVAANNF